VIDTDAEFTDLPSLVARHARARPRAPALDCEGERLDWAAFDARAERAAAALQRDGGVPGQVVAVCAATSADYVVLFVGALRAGLAIAPLAPGSTPAQLAAMVADSGAIRVFVDGTVAPALHEQPLAAPVTRLDGDAFEDWLAPGAPRAVAIEAAWPFNLIYSSGTTGTPKGIVQPHAMRWAHIRRAALSGYGPETVALIATPLYSNTTLVAVVPTLAFGGCLVLMPKFDAARYLQLAEHHRATHTMLVPVQYQRLMAHADFEAHDLSAFRFKSCTSAPFAAALKADVVRRWPGALVEYYGMTEGGGTCVLQAHLFPHKLHTVGQPVEGHDMRLIDEAGRELPPGATGEVVGRSPGMMTGYHNQPVKTAEAEWFDDQGRRYIRSGDIGRFDDDGFLVLLDRRKDMVISGGFNLYPSDLEAVLREHPAVADCAVVGVPSVQWGETPVAWVVPRAGSNIEAEPLREWANARLGRTQRLAGLRLTAELPRSAIGKVLKRELREAWADAVVTPPTSA